MAIQRSLRDNVIDNEMAVERLTSLLDMLGPQAAYNGHHDVWKRLICRRSGLQIRIGRYAEAASALRPYLGAGQPLQFDSFAHNHYARALMYGGRPDRARSHLRQHTKAGGVLCDNPFAHVLLGKSRHKIKNSVSPQILVPPLRLPPDAPCTAVGLICAANKLIKSAQYEEAIAYLQPFLRPGNSLCDEAVAHNSFANALIKAQRSRQAMDYLWPLLLPGGMLHQDGVSHNTFAKALLTTGNYQMVQNHLQPLMESGKLLHENAFSKAIMARARAAQDEHENEERGLPTLQTPNADLLPAPSRAERPARQEIRFSLAALRAINPNRHPRKLKPYRPDTRKKAYENAVPAKG
ncbi:MAG: hypothetical protein IPI58_07420 [Alphaproteobacteria bacterium]|nr:MAG: hypothetical protein IPI58_07420 [Alphaproteobacteria bacterium]